MDRHSTCSHSSHRVWRCNVHVVFILSQWSALRMRRGSDIGTFGEKTGDRRLSIPGKASFSCSGNDFNFNQCPFRQSLYSNGRPCRVWLCEKLCINSVHIRKVVHVSHEDCCFHDIAHRKPCFFENSLHVEQSLAGLFLDTTFYKHSGSRVDGNLTRGIDKIAYLYGLTIRSYGRRCL